MDQQEACDEHQKEKWSLLASILHVLLSTAYIGGNIALFLLYMLPVVKVRIPPLLRIGFSLF